MFRRHGLHAGALAGLFLAISCAAGSAQSGTAKAFTPVAATAPFDIAIAVGSGNAARSIAEPSARGNAASAVSLR